jgi:hypothetical protein
LGGGPSVELGAGRRINLSERAEVR